MNFVPFADKMDKQLQEGYEHAVPKIKDVSMGVAFRSALIFRQGRNAKVKKDSAMDVCRISMLDPPTPRTNIIGPMNGPCEISSMKNGLQEGGMHAMRELYCSLAHGADRAAVSGSIKAGAASVLVRQNREDKREAFGLEWAMITSTRMQYGGALATSYHKQQSVRLFVNSDCGVYAPNERNGRKMNFYCGLYVVEKMWNGEGLVTEKCPTASRPHEQYTYLLRRLPKGNGNLISAQQLFDKLLDGKGMAHRRFRPSQPIDCTGVAIPDDFTSRKSKSKRKKKQ